MSEETKVIQSDADQPGEHLKRGAIPTPRHRLAAAKPFRALRVALPTSVVFVPSKLSMWGNNQYGDCVSAEEAFAKACGQNGVFIPEAEVIRWARANDVLNGAMLDDVMEKMARNGFHDSGHVFGDGADTLAVDYSNPEVLKAALSEAPVKIAIDANALPGGAGNGSGWFKLGGRPGQYPNTDHCVALAGYGKASVLFAALGSPVPASVDPNADVYLLFTWAGIGVVDQAWVMSTCTEAWLRRPTTTVDGKAEPQPGPGPTPVPPTPTPNPTPTPVPPTPNGGLPVWVYVVAGLALVGTGVAIGLLVSKK